MFPEYEFKNNKVYGTKVHINALNKFKATPIHRKSFKIVKNNLPNYKFINSTYGMYELSQKIIGVNYIKNNYKLIDKNINIDNCSIDWVFKKKHILYFIKMANPINDEMNIEKESYNKIINVYLLEKDIKSEFKLIVNSVDYFKNKKPLINRIEIS